MKSQVTILCSKFESKMTFTLTSTFSVKYFSFFHLNLLSERTLIEMSQYYDFGIAILNWDIYLRLYCQYNLVVYSLMRLSTNHCQQNVIYIG